MTTVCQTVLVPFSDTHFFNVVNDIPAYPSFLPWCSGATVFLNTDALTRARIMINYHGLKTSFSTENIKAKPEKITMNLLEGPFKNLEGYWLFEKLGREGCKVNFRLQYELNTLIFNKLMGKVFDEISQKMVEAFVQRARLLKENS